MIKSRCFKMVVMTGIFVIVTTLFVGCGSKTTTTTTTTTAKDPTEQDQSNVEVKKNEEIKPVDSTKTDSKNIVMNATMQKQLDTFFSNFSESYVEPFEKGEIEDANLIRFGALHVILNNTKLVENKGENNFGYIKTENVDAASLYFFGKKPQKHTNIEGYTYENGYYKFPRATGEVYTFSQVDKLDDLGSNTYKAEVSIYTASSGFAGDSHGTMEQWKASGEDIPKLNKRINAVIQKINDNGKERYILMEYRYLK